MPDDASESRTRVLIVGAGPVGLGLAIELGLRGVACTLVEQSDRVGHAPRAKTTNVRTREHFRRWGIAGDLRAASPFGVSYPSDIVFCTRLAGYEITRFENAFYCAPGRNPLYAEHAQWIPQYKVEEVMRRKAHSIPQVRIRFHTELLAFSQSAAGVEATVRDVESGEESRLFADYLVGADGARSRVRQQLGFVLEGASLSARHLNFVIRAPGLAQAHALGRAVMYWQVNPDVPSICGPMDDGDRWFFAPTGVPRDWKLAPRDAPELLRRATGIDRPYEVLSSDEWNASALLANRYRDRRVFLAGDACHVHPPFGAFGMNMGIADGVDLGWKLAAVLEGWGGETLLASYEIERRPTHQMVLEEASANHAVLTNQLVQPGLEDAGERGAAVRREIGARVQAAKFREFATLGVIKGYRYEHSPVVIGDGTPAPGRDFVNYVPSSRPGSLAPHAWLHDGTSLYDAFGTGFTLLARKNAPGIDQARRDARAAGVPLLVLQPEEPGIADLYPSRLTLIRPDQHVAWRGDAWQARIFERVTGRVPSAATEAA